MRPLDDCGRTGLTQNPRIDSLARWNPPRIRGAWSALGVSAIAQRKRTPANHAGARFGGSDAHN